MLAQSEGVSLLNLPARSLLVPVVETRIQFIQALDMSAVRAMLLHHCNVFEFADLMARAARAGCAVYVNMDHIDGIYADEAGFQYLAERLRARGVISSHPKALALAKQAGLETIQRIFAVDSAGLMMALESVDLARVDMLDFAPALVVPHIMPRLRSCLPIPFMASGLLHTTAQLQEVIKSGVQAVAVTHPEKWIQAM